MCVNQFTFCSKVATTLIVPFSACILIPKTCTILPNLEIFEGWIYCWVILIHECMLIYHTFQEISACSKVFVECSIVLVSSKRLLLLFSWRHSLLRHLLPLRNYKELILYPTLHTNAHKMVNSMAPKSDPKWCETWPIRPTTASHLSLHCFWATTFTISHFGSTQESFYS